MNVNLGNAVGAVGLALNVVTDYFRELIRIGVISARLEFDRDVGGQTFHVVVLLDTPVFEMVANGPDSPRTRLHLTGTVEVRPINDPGAPATTFPLDAGVRLTVVLIPIPGAVAKVGFRYDGVDGMPTPPVTADDINSFMMSAEIQAILANAQLPIADSFVAGLNVSLFPEEPRPANADWVVQLTLTPAGADTVDAFVVSVAPPGTSATISITESFVAHQIPIDLAVAYNRSFLNVLLARGAQKETADAKKGKRIDGGKVTSLDLVMVDTGIKITGHIVRDIDTPLIDLAPDVDIDIDGIGVPKLIRGTTGMTMNNSGVDVHVDESDEIFYGALKWVVTIGAFALLFPGVDDLIAIGISLWIVSKVWDASADLDNAPDTVRDTLGKILGDKLSEFAKILNQSTPVGALTVDGTPDSAYVVDGNLVFFAQIIISPMMARLRSAEYSHKLRRFAIFELDNHRRFRAQELARLMKAGKITVAGFHHVRGKYVRSDHDNSAANNLLHLFKSNETTEVVVRNL